MVPLLNRRQVPHTKFVNKFKIKRSTKFACQSTSSDELRKIFRYIKVKVKLKCTLLQALRLCTGRTARRESRGIALLIHDHGTGRG